MSGLPIRALCRVFLGGVSTGSGATSALCHTTIPPAIIGWYVRRCYRGFQLTTEMSTRCQRRVLSPEEAAEAYEALLKRFYGTDKLFPQRPIFDVTLLGIGEDGLMSRFLRDIRNLSERLPQSLLQTLRVFGKALVRFRRVD